ncbi:MAG TPA: integration host factor subunit beta, partial [Xanthobacteraceae bacterium]
AHVSVEGKSVPFFKTGKEMRERLNRAAPAEAAEPVEPAAVTR